MNTDPRSHHSQNGFGCRGQRGDRPQPHRLPCDASRLGYHRRIAPRRESTNRVRYISADLLDREDTIAKLSSLTEVTHIFYAAYQDRPTWAELVAPNLAMLVHVVEAIEPIADNLQHVSLMQGYKVYGAHLGPFKTPARETDANHMPPEFNVDQQNFLEERQQGKAWTWSALRPSVVSGFALETR